MEQKTITYEEFFTPGFFKFAFFPHSFFNSLRGLVVQRSMSVFENRKCHPPQAIKNKWRGTQVVKGAVC